MRVWLFAAAVGSIFAAAASRFAVNDSDVFWHLATARWMLAHGALARTDVFSSTVAGQPIPVDQWLGQLALWAAYGLGSWWGVVALRTLAVWAIATIVLRTALRRAARPWIGVLAAFPGLALSRFVWGDRPELLGLVGFAAFVPLALAARSGDRRALVGLPPLFLVWANVHGGYVVGIVLLAALVLESAIVERTRARALALSAIGSLVATFLTPSLLAVYESPGWHFANPPRFIQEWGVPDVTTFPGALFAVALLGAFAVALAARGGATSDAAILVPLAFLGLSALRHMPLLAIAAAPYLAGVLPEALARVGAHVRPAIGAPPRLASAVLAVAVVAVSLATAPRRPDLAGFPVATLDALAAAPGTLFNEYDWGGYLIFFAPEHPVFVDGRLRPYVGPVLDDYVSLIALRPSWHAALDRRGIALVLVRPTRALAVALRAEGWETLFADDDAVLLRRPAVASSPFGGADAPILGRDAGHDRGHVERRPRRALQHDHA